MPSQSALLARAAMLCAVSVAVGCATTQQQGGTAEDLVKARAQQRWDALLKGDTKAAYGYLSPGSRAVTSVEAYESSIRAGFWKSAVVEGASCSTPDSCEARAQIEYEYRGSRVKTPLSETWIRQEGNWWLVLKQ